jgi:hypothetical protein
MISGLSSVKLTTAIGVACFWFGLQSKTLGIDGWRAGSLSHCFSATTSSRMICYRSPDLEGTVVSLELGGTLGFLMMLITVC